MSGHRHCAPGQHEHDFEPARGLPAPLPEGERILWQGAPDWRTLALRAFHVRKVAIWFGLMLVLRAVNTVYDGGSAFDALTSVLWLSVPFAAALGILLYLAWLSARTTMYTLTDRRVVMRVGIVLTLTFNLPLRHVAAAGLRVERDGHGDIPLAIAPPNRIAFLHLWPHARPWKVARPEPMLRSIPDAARVARMLTEAWALATGRSVEAAVASVPDRAPAAAAREEAGVSRGRPRPVPAH